VLRVLVEGQHVGAVERVGDVVAAQWYAALRPGGTMRDRYTEHGSVDEAVRAVLRSGFARQLGARADSRVSWTDKARRRAAQSTRERITR
jgi:hypothetical protein